MANSLDELLNALDGQESQPLVGTSVKLPQNLRAAAQAARKLGLIKSTSEIAGAGMRDQLTALANRAALDEHYARVPSTRPSLAQITHAYAQLHGHVLAERFDLIKESADRVVIDEPNADAHDVLIYATALLRERNNAA